MPTDPKIPLTLPLPGEELQGVYLLGNFADGFATGGKHISAVAPTGLRIRVDHQALIVSTGSGPPITPTLPLDLPVSPPGTGILRINAVGATGYQLDYVDATGKASPYCDATQSPDAIAMQGEWTTSGLHDLGDMVTFACHIEGKAAECETWGYPPETTGTVGPGALMWDLNQACTQMAMARYCMDDKSYTREKTPILVRDFLTAVAEPPDSGGTRLARVPASYPPVPPPPDQFFYEAAWAPRQPVLCLSKLRWASSDPGTLCPGIVPDPRVDQNAKYCEDAHLDLGDRNLANGSETMDMQMHRWASPTGEMLTSVRGFIVNADDPSKSVPPAGYVAPALSREGFMLRNLTGEFATCGCVVKAFRMRNTVTGDSVVGPRSMLDLLSNPTDYTFDVNSDFEGWLITEPAADRLPFYLYQRGSDYVTATKPPTLGITGFKRVGGPTAPPLGYVIAAGL